MCRCMARTRLFFLSCCARKKSEDNIVCPQVALVLTYLLCGLFNSGGFVLNFILVALLISADFWYCKARSLELFVFAACAVRTRLNVSWRK